MKILGVRCSNLDYTFAVVDGTQEKPNILERKTFPFPSFERLKTLQWLYKEIEDLIHKYEPRGVMIKRAEFSPQKKTTLFQRVENEAIVLLAVANKNIDYFDDRIKSTIAKKLGYKGKGHYLNNYFINKKLPDLDKESDKIKEAVLVAISGL